MRFKTIIFLVIVISSLVLCYGYTSGGSMDLWFKFSHNTNTLSTTAFVGNRNTYRVHIINLCGYSGWCVEALAIRDAMGNRSETDGQKSAFVILAFPRTKKSDVVDAVLIVHEKMKIRSDYPYFYEINGSCTKQVKVDLLQPGFYHYILSLNELSKEELAKYSSGQWSHESAIELSAEKQN